MTIPDIVSVVDDWSLKYSLEEVKRAALYAINHSDTAEYKCKIASQLACVFRRNVGQVVR